MLWCRGWVVVGAEGPRGPGSVGRHGWEHRLCRQGWGCQDTVGSVWKLAVATVWSRPLGPGKGSREEGVACVG